MSLKWDEKITAIKTGDGVTALAHLANSVVHLGINERRILALIAARLEFGQRQYGEFADSDPRDMVRETMDEALDGLIYATRKIITIL
jgi:hypothetical protein